jgi:hypothetical protein
LVFTTFSVFFFVFFFSESVEARPLLGLLVEEFSVSDEEDSLPEDDEEEDEEELLDEEESEAEDPSWNKYE